MKDLKKWSLKTVLVCVLPLAVLYAAYLVFGLVASWFLSGLSQSSDLRTVLNYLPVSANRVWIAVTTISQIRVVGLGWLGLDFGPESTPLAKFAVVAISNVLMINLGLALVVMCHRRGKVWLFWGGLCVVVGILKIAATDLSPEILEEMGLGFLVAPFVEGRPKDYQYLLEGPVPMAIKLVLMIFGFAPPLLTWALVKFRNRIKGVWLARGSLAVIVLSGLLILILLAQPNNREPQTPTPAIAVTYTATPQPSKTATPTATVTVPLKKVRDFPYAVPTLPAPPAVVKLNQVNGEWELLVNGKQTVIRGVQYYFGYPAGEVSQKNLPVLDRDLAIIQQAGFNTVTGWEEEGFTSEFMQLAEDLNLWVIRPIFLDPPPGSYVLKFGSLRGGDFLDPGFREKVKENVRQKVLSGKNSPALLFWNVGADEPLEKMASRGPAQIQAAADLIVEITVMIWEVDPNHPVIISEPQDWRISFYQSALNRVRAQGFDPTRFFIYGGNFYGHPDPVLADMKRTKSGVLENLGVMFGVMETAPFGVDSKYWANARVKTAKDVERLTPISVSYVFNPAADPANPNAPDPTMAIVTGLAMTDVERNDNNGALKALAASRNRPFFPVALKLIKDPTRVNLLTVPLTSPTKTGEMVEQVFAGQKVEGGHAIFRWVYNERTGETYGPITAPQVEIERRNGVKVVLNAFLQKYLELGGPPKFGLPANNTYETVYLGKKVLRQDFSRGWSLILERP